jgi:hypothetical protein
MVYARLSRAGSVVICAMRHPGSHAAHKKTGHRMIRPPNAEHQRLGPFTR